MSEYMQALAILMATRTVLTTYSNQKKAHETSSSQPSEALLPFRFPLAKTPALAATQPAEVQAPAHDTPLAA